MIIKDEYDTFDGYVDALEDRIAELEAEEQLFNKTFDAQQAEIEELRADSQRLRDEVTRLEGIIARWGEHTQMYEARIAELEAACEKAEYELDWHSDELRTLEAENARLRDTIIYAKGRMKAYGIVDARIDLPGGWNEK